MLFSDCKLTHFLIPLQISPFTNGIIPPLNIYSRAITATKRSFSIDKSWRFLPATQ